MRLKLTKPDKRCKRFRASGLCNTWGITLIGPDFSAPENGVQRSNARALCTCKHCGVLFKPKATDRVTFCSRECAFAYKEKNKSPVYTVIHAGYCKGCGSAFVSRNARSKYCSAACVVRVRPAYVSTAPSVKACKCCGSEYKPKSKTCPELYCSNECKDKVKHAQKRVDRLKRKALVRGVTVEGVDPFRVFDRDQWRCQLCGARTPRAKRGTYSDNAPELDHILPLAKGGEHSYLNTQCACRKCNSLKSDAPRGQMLMFG